ncbi:hypothetical protein [Crossiella sp. CA198]|uniref:hypothetical protein n=1 Tax=Crossiella sp. CA198 TaxID=3455607 RepID=UPI003F8D4544
MGASESNAGDDFHFWWAARRALQLIAPGAHLKRVVVEGLAAVDDPDDQYEIVDVGEYFGGGDFDSADSVILSQLKYSTREPTKVWTKARLTEKRSRRSSGAASAKSPRSLIADLANTYKLLVDEHDHDAVSDKVRIRLVSNQPVDRLVVETVTAAASWVRSKNGATLRLAHLRSALSSAHVEVIDAFHKAVGQRLNSAQFCGLSTTPQD